MSTHIKAVIFDLDNTLLDFMKMKDAAIHSAVDAMVEAGLTVEKEDAVRAIEDIYRSKGYEYQEVFDDYLRQNSGFVDYKYLASAIVAYRRAKEASLMLYPRVNVTLMALAKVGLKLGVVSDAPSREAWMRLCYLNLHHLFDAVVTFNDTGVHKPAPEPFDKICKLLEVKPEEVLMVGDWPEKDMVGARQVGMTTAFARYGDTLGVKESGADYDLSDIYQLVEIVRERNQQ
ncbi:TIGR02253 family HAD-type hydrolase [Candidatus Neomarinimicrobiota bacterium]